MYTVVPNGSQIIIIVYLLIQLHEIILKTFDSGQKLLINDCRGIPKGVTEKDIYEKDLKSIIMRYFFPIFFLNTNAILRIVVDLHSNDIFFRMF